MRVWALYTYVKIPLEKSYFLMWSAVGKTHGRTTGKPWGDFYPGGTLVKPRENPFFLGGETGLLAAPYVRGNGMEISLGGRGGLILSLAIFFFLGKQKMKKNGDLICILLFFIFYF